MRTILLATIWSLILPLNAFARIENRITTKKISNFDLVWAKCAEPPAFRQDNKRKKRKSIVRKKGTITTAGSNDQKTKNRRSRSKYANQEVSYRKKTRGKVVWKERPPLTEKNKTRGKINRTKKNSRRN